MEQLFLDQFTDKKTEWTAKQSGASTYKINPQSQSGEIKEEIQSTVQDRIIEAEQVLDTLGLKACGWKIAINKALRQAGVCIYTTKNVSFSIHYFKICYQLRVSSIVPSRIFALFNARNGTRARLDQESKRTWI